METILVVWAARAIPQIATRIRSMIRGTTMPTVAPRAMRSDRRRGDETEHDTDAEYTMECSPQTIHGPSHRHDRIALCFMDSSWPCDTRLAPPPRGSGM